MMISKIFINVGSYNFCCCNRFDHSSRTTCTVSSCKYTWHIQEISSCSCHDLTTLYRNSCFCEMICLNILTNCHNKDITWNILIWLSCCFLLVSFTLMFIREELEENPVIEKDLTAIRQETREIDRTLKQELQEEQRELTQSARK